MSSRGSSQRPAGDPRRSPVPGNGGLWRRSVGSISRVERRGEAAEHRRSDCPEEVARMQPRVPPTMAAEQAGVSKIGSWWRLALGPPGGEGGVAGACAVGRCGRRMSVRNMQCDQRGVRSGARRERRPSPFPSCTRPRLCVVVKGGGQRTRREQQRSPAPMGGQLTLVGFSAVGTYRGRP